MTVAYTLSTLKGALKINVNQAAQDNIVSGYESSALGDPHRYGSEEHDQLNLIGASALGAPITYRCVRVSDGVEDYFLHSAAQLKQVLADGAARKLSILQAAKNGRDNVEAATDSASAQTAADTAIAAINAL